MSEVVATALHGRLWVENPGRSRSGGPTDTSSLQPVQTNAQRVYRKCPDRKDGNGVELMFVDGVDVGR